jgi:IS30 family transposase
MEGYHFAHRKLGSRRARPGHWEGDLLSGANNTHIATLVKRHTRFTVLLKVPSKDTTTVVATLAKQVRKLPHELRRSLTWDRGQALFDKSWKMPDIERMN